jgi:hypothetical protein
MASACGSTAARQRPDLPLPADRRGGRPAALALAAAPALKREAEKNGPKTNAITPDRRKLDHDLWPPFLIDLR